MCNSWKPTATCTARPSSAPWPPWVGSINSTTLPLIPSLPACFVSRVAPGEVLAQVPWNQLRLVVAHDPRAAAQASAKRDAQIQALQEQAPRLRHLARVTR